LASGSGDGKINLRLDAKLVRAIVGSSTRRELANQLGPSIVRSEDIAIPSRL